MKINYRNICHKDSRIVLAEKICYAMKEHVCQLIVINYYIQIINPINIYKGTQHFYVSMVVKNFLFYNIYFTRGACMMMTSFCALFAQCKPNMSMGRLVLNCDLFSMQGPIN